MGACLKSFIVFSLFLSAIQTWAFVPNYDQRPEINMVLGVDKTIPTYQNPFRFPCTQFQGSVYCDKTGISFKNIACANTLWVDRLAHKMEVSCLINLKKVVIATTDFRSKVSTGSLSKFDYYPLQFTKAVRLQRVSSRDLGLEIVVSPSLL